MPMGHGMSCPYRLTLTPGPLSLWAYYMIVFVEWGCHPELEGVKARDLNPPNPPLLKGAISVPLHQRRAMGILLYQRGTSRIPLVKSAGKSPFRKGGFPSLA
jgi:hypothetical protein